MIMIIIIIVSFTPYFNKAGLTRESYGYLQKIN